MKIIFTICSNNYLAQAKTLGDSILKFNPDYKFIICLCDKKSQKVDYSFFEPHVLVEVSDIGIEKFAEMNDRYNIIELNTSIKPFVFDYLYKVYSDADFVMYFDPDTCVFDCLKSIEDELEDNSILLTPHICTPIEPDGKMPTENTFTQYGLYNLGFLATKRSINTVELLNWWMRRLEINCYSKPQEGIFVDQLPMNFAPIFFEKVRVSNNLGLNMAPWNLHERELTIENGHYFVNERHPLCFYHFSNCNPLDLDLLSTHYNRITFDGHDVLKIAYDEYKAEVIKNKYEHFSSMVCAYALNSIQTISIKEASVISKIFRYIKRYPLFIFRKDFWV